MASLKFMKHWFLTVVILWICQAQAFQNQVNISASPWNAATQVAGPFALGAFVVVAVALVLLSLINQKAKIVRTAPEDQSLAMVERLAAQFHVDTSGLTKDQKFQIVMEQIRNRQKTYNFFIVLIGILGLASLGLWAYASSPIERKNSNTALSLKDLEKKIMNETGTAAQDDIGELERRLEEEDKNTTSPSKVISALETILKHPDKQTQLKAAKVLADQISKSKRGKEAMGILSDFYLDVPEDDPLRQLVNDHLSKLSLQDPEIIKFLWQENQSESPTHEVLTRFLRNLPLGNSLRTELLKSP